MHLDLNNFLGGGPPDPPLPWGVFIGGCRWTMRPPGLNIYLIWPLQAKRLPTPDVGYCNAEIYWVRAVTFWTQ